MTDEFSAGGWQDRIYISQVSLWLMYAKENRRGQGRKIIVRAQVGEDGELDLGSGSETGKSQDTGVEVTYCSDGFSVRERGKNQGSPSGFSALNN